jgi:hypothetical protein
MAAQQMHREGQRCRGRLMPGKQEDQDLVTDLLLAHRRAGLRVAGSEQQRNQILTRFRRA